MHPELVPIAHLFAQNDRTLGRLLGDFTAEEWRLKDPGGHTPRWIMGHLAATRMRVLELMGLEPPRPEWLGLFGRGSADTCVPEGFDMAPVLQAFHELQSRMAARWDELGPEVLEHPLGRTLPDGSETVGGALGFLLWHETYHVGQLGLLRKLAGKSGLA